MKKLILFICWLFLGMYISAQDDQGSRNGKWTLEFGNSVLTGTSNAGTGANVLFGDGATLTTIGLNMGKFVSEDLAIKLNVGLFSISGFGDSSLFTLTGGAKYYITGVAPLELGVGLISGSGDSQGLIKGTIGYAIPLADNINIEPAVGAILVDGESNALIQVAFALFF